MDNLLDEIAEGKITYVRIPPRLREVIAAKAKAETRTINGQIIHLILKGLELSTPTTKKATPK